MEYKSESQFSEYQMFVLEKPEIDCIDVVKLMGELHDRELTKTLAGRLNQHITDCPHCKRFESSYRAVVQLANDLGKGQQPVPQPVKNRLRQALNERLGLKLPVQSEANQ